MNDTEPLQIVEEKRISPRDVSQNGDGISRDVASGITRRINAILNGDSSDYAFSSSAAPVIEKEFGGILMRQGAVSVIEDPSQNHGESFISRNANGEFVTRSIPPNGRLIVKPTPFISIPDKPASPDDISNRAELGELRFEYTPTKTMAAAKYSDNKWGEMHYMPAGSIDLSPTADRYGQSIFGGNRALRLENGEVALFRPEMHARRFIRNAQRLKMPALDEAQLIEAYKELVRANLEYMPKPGKGSIYLAPGQRPTKNQLGVKPNSEYVFSCMAIPAGKIFSKPARLRVEKQFHRASVGGVGDVKAAGNYAPTFAPKEAAHDSGFDDIIYADGTNIETRELSSSNIFFITDDDVLVTPNLSGEILDGITRDSILVIGQELKATGRIRDVRVGPVSLSQYPKMRESFSCGTGVTLNSVESITDGDVEYSLDTSHNGLGPVTELIATKFNQILLGNERDNPYYSSWLTMVE